MRNAIPILLIIAAVGFTIYAVRTQYGATDPTKSPPARVWASVVAAAGAIGAAAADLLIKWMPN